MAGMGMGGGGNNGYQDNYDNQSDSKNMSGRAASHQSGHPDPAAREEIVMVQPGGESNPAGDSEHHTSMHVPHGTKQQEEEEEELKRMMAK
ncbi:hypothetical protein RHOSPDRAFT_34432 [Rhodotorula sp. JG-1b]|nr:hypothetical protein RHOSPDRAFT_34432 [Rhodotorula sp. JG-1b]